MTEARDGSDAHASDDATHDARRSQVSSIMRLVMSKYVRRPEDERIERAINKAIDDTLAGSEARGVVVTALSGAGKTTLLNRLFDRHPKLGTGPDAPCRMIKVAVQAPCTLKGLGRAVCWAAGYPIQSNPDAGVIWDRARQQLQAERIRFISFDEIQNVTATARAGEDTKILDTIKSLLINPAFNIGLILAGQPSIVPFLEADGQVSRRLAFNRIDPIGQRSAAAMKTIITSLAETAGLRFDQVEADWLMPRLIHAALNQFGSAIEMARDVIALACEEPVGTLRREHFARDFASRTSNAAFANPYLSIDWQALDCSRRGITRPQQLIVANAKAAPSGRRGARR